ncbi:MAG: PAS domain S-box protein [Rhodanobacter sp.]
MGEPHNAPSGPRLASSQEPDTPSVRRAESDLAQLLACGEINVVLLDPDLRIRRMAASTRRLLCVDPAIPLQSLDDLAGTLQCPELLPDARSALQTGETTLRNLRLPGRETYLALRFYRGHGAAGEADSLLLSIVDTTERRKANSVARHLASIVKYSDDAILSKDLNGVITSWNNGAERLFGYTAEETMGRPVTLLIPDGMPDEEPGILERIRRGQAIDHYQTTRRRKDGSLVDVSLCVSPMFDTDGRVTGASKIARDVTHEKRAKHQREVLINELNHRVKNTLATVQSIAYQSLHHANSLDGFAETFDARLLALSKTTDLLTTGDWICAPMHDLVLNELAPYKNEANAARIRGEDIQLQPRMVMAFGMLIHELTTNAVKYGALSRPGGHVDVGWQADGAGPARRLRFSWKESDGPPITQAPTRKGMGSRLLKTLAASLGGSAELVFASTGVCCVIDIPWTKAESIT